MQNYRNQSGQTLVELALVLPVFCLGIFMGVQLIWLCHNMVELQRMAQVAAYAITQNNYQNHARYSRYKSLEGQVTPIGKRFTKNHLVENWKPFHGKSTIQQPGRIIEVHLQNNLLPGEGFTRGLSLVKQEGSGVQFLEPAVEN